MLRLSYGVKALMLSLMLMVVGVSAVHAASTPKAPVAAQKATRFSATAPNTSVLTWVAPTGNTDGTAIQGTLTYNVFYGLNGAALAQIVTGVTALTYTDSQVALVDGATACYTVSATEGGTQGAQSAQACKTFPNAVPTAPTGLTVK